MTLKNLLSVCLSFFVSAASGATVERDVLLETGTGQIHGTLLLPSTQHKGPVALFIAGSGPTNRDGNAPGLTNNALRSLAEGLAERGIGSLRYDKRGVGASSRAGQSEQDLRFDIYVLDAEGWLRQLKRQYSFSKIVTLGHSEGSLIGMLASKDGLADGFISIAGPGETGAAALRRQLQGKLPPELQEVSNRILTALASGTQVSAVPPDLHTLYRPSVQPYMISWFKSDPVLAIKKLRVPAAIIQGDADLQVTVADARMLHAANPANKLLIIPGMNHVLKLAAGTEEQQMSSYTTPSQLVAKDLVSAVSSWILNLSGKSGD